MIKIGSQTNLKILSALIIIGVALFTFKDITQIFFQQDEWLGLGGAITRSEEGGIFKAIQDVFTPQEKGARILPVTAITNYLVFTSFLKNPAYYGILALVLIIFSSILLNLALYRLTKSFFLSIITPLMWFTNNLSLQAVTFPGAVITSQFSFLFFALSFYLLVLFLTTSGKSLFLWLCILFMVLSLWAKETGVFYILVFPVLIWLFAPKVMGIIQKTRVTILLAIPLFVGIIGPQLLFSPDVDTQLSSSLKPSANIENVIYNVFLLPARSLGQIFIPAAKVYPFAFWVNEVHYNIKDGSILESAVADLFSILVSFHVLLIIFIAVVIGRTDDRKLVIFGLFAFLVSLLPFVFFQNSTSLLEERYYIFPALWAGLIFASVASALFWRLPKVNGVLLLIVFIPLLAVNIGGVRRGLIEDIEVGHYRRAMLENILEIKPYLQDENIFFVAEEGGGFYDFQSGFGQTLAVWFYDTGKIPRGALTDLDFWELDYEGIKNYSGNKYGYFMNYDKLLSALKENSDFVLAGIHSFKWDPQNHTVTDISEEIRKKISEDL